MKKIVFLVAALCIMGIAGTGMGQMRDGAFEISPFIGGYQFEGNQELDHTFIGGLRLGYAFTKHFSGEILGNYGNTRYTETSPDIRTRIFNYRAEGLYHFMPDSRFVPFVALGAGAQRNDYVRNIDEKWRFVGDYGAGVKFFLTESFALRADVRHVLASGSVYNNLEYTLGLSFLFGGAKKPAAAVAEPVAPPPPPPAPAPRAPLAAPLGLSALASSDSQADLNWNCVQDATGYKVYRDNAFAFAAKDCSASDRGLNADTRYCYQVAATDDEGRESALSNEDCAKTPAKPAPVQEMKKPAEAAAAEAVAKEIREKGRAAIDIKFDFDKAVVKPMYHAELSKFALVLKDNPDLNIIIEGHTDSVGNAAYNKKLSQKRADNIRAYLMKNFGVAEDRLTAKGYGEERPIDTNKTSAGRANNRRAEAVADYIIIKKQ